MHHPDRGYIRFVIAKGCFVCVLLQGLGVWFIIVLDGFLPELGFGRYADFQIRALTL